MCITQDLKLQTVFSILSIRQQQGFQPDPEQSAGGGSERETPEVVN